MRIICTISRLRISLKLKHDLKKKSQLPTDNLLYAVQNLLWKYCFLFIELFCYIQSNMERKKSCSRSQLCSHLCRMQRVTCVRARGEREGKPPWKVFLLISRSHVGQLMQGLDACVRACAAETIMIISRLASQLGAFAYWHTERLALFYTKPSRCHNSPSCPCV